MKAIVHVTLKPGVLDPQGKAIHHACESLGYAGINDIRQGKFFVISIDPSADAEKARQDVEKIASDVLANPVIEDYSVEIRQ
jgi:phosphoribosylformylglycinamidine synthase subunit PurS